MSVNCLVGELSCSHPDKTAPNVIRDHTVCFHDKNSPSDFLYTIYAADVISRKHFFDKNIARIRVKVYKQGSYRQVCVKFKDFSKTSKILSYCFQGL